MKRHLIIYIAFTLLLAACGPTPSLPKRGGGNDAVATQLALIDSLADVNPDSADVLLISTPSPSLKGGEKEVWELLRIKIDDKLYRPVTHYRDTILQLIDYFERHPRVLPRLLGSTGPALPYLYAGRIYSDLGDAPQALDYYERALDVMPVGQIENGEWKIENEETRRLAKQRGLLHSFIGTLFSYQNLYDEALKHYKVANRWAMTARDTIDVIFNLRDIAEQYKFLAKYDSSLYFYHKSSGYAVKLGWKRKHNELRTQMASVYIRKDDYAKALQLIWPSLHDVDTLNITSTYGVASKIYEHLGILDSAYYCYEKLLKYGNLYGKSYAHKKMAERAFKENRLQEMYHHLMLYNESADTIRERKNAEVSSRMHAAYNYQKHERKVKELELQNERKRNAIYFGVIVFLFAAIVIFHYIRSEMKNKVRLKQRLDMLNMKLSEYDKGRNPENWIRRVKEYEDQIHQLQEQLSQKNSDFNVEREILSSRISKLTDEKRSLELSIQRASNRVLDADLAVKTFSQTEIYKLFIRKAYIASAVTGEEWDDFIAQAEGNFFPGFRDNLAALCKISEQEYRMCLLFKSAFSKSQVATLLFVDRSAVSHAFERLYKKAVKRQGKTKDWEVILSSL